MLRLKSVSINVVRFIGLCIITAISGDKVSKGAKISNRYNQVPHLAHDTSEKVTNSQLDTANESQVVSPFQAGDHKAKINRRTQKYNKQKREKTYLIHKRSTALERSVKYSLKIFY